MKLLHSEGPNHNMVTVKITLDNINSMNKLIFSKKRIFHIISVARVQDHLRFCL